MDFTDQYNTNLNPDQEAAFQKWLKEQGQSQGRDMSKDLQDYDMRGFYQNQGQFADNGHASDMFKKPNHPTFSDQSIYNGANGMQGGHWNDNSFQASPINTIFRSPDQLQSYFDKVEPDTQLRFKNIKSRLQGK